VAWVTRSVWALTVSWVVSAVLKLVLGHLALPGSRNRFRWDREAVKTLVSFGRWIFLSTLLTFLAMNSDRLIFGKLLPIGLLGVYGISSIWANIPGAVLSRVFGNVALPVLSKVKNQGGAVGPVFRETREKVLVLGAWATSGLIAGAAPLIRLFYDERAADGIWIIPLLAIGVWFATLENSNSSASLAMGRPKWLAAANGAKVIGMVVFLPLGGMLGGFSGAIIALAVADLFKYLVSAVGVARVGASAWAQDLLLTFAVAAVALTTLAVRRAAGADHLPALVDGALVTVTTTAAWAVLVGGVWALRLRTAPAAAA
jgi:O-antigen/teichoic acid export membrane protein